MFRVLWAGLLSAAGLLLIGLPPLAAEEGRTPKPYVLLIGVSQYEDKDIQAKPHAEDDAKALYDLVTSKDHLGVDADHVRLLLGKPDAGRKSLTANRDNIRKAFNWLSSNAKPDDLVIIAFFGQGGPVGEGGQKRCYFAVDSTIKDRARDAVAAAEIGEEMDKLKSQRVCMLLDVNFKGFSADPMPEVSLSDSLYKEFLGEADGPEKNPLPGRVLYLATLGLTPGIDLKENGLFARALLDGLKGAADKDGYEPDGLITTEELSTWLDKEMPRLRREHAPEAKRSQHFVFNTLNNRFALTTNPEALTKARQQLDKLAQFAKSGKVTATLAREGQTLLERMPKLEAQRSLRKEYQKLVDGGQTLEQLQANREKLLESMKLSPVSARDFTSKVMDVLEMVQEEYVKEVNAGELVGNAIRGLYRRLDEPMPQEVRERLDKVKKMSKTELSGLLIDVRTVLGKREDLDEHKDIDIALQRMLAPLDPYTIYVGPADKARFEVDFKANYSGIGAQIRKDDATDTVRIVTPIKDGPAYKLGIQADDLIVKITRNVDSDGKPLTTPEVLETKDMALTEVVKKLLGKAGTKVKITIRHDGAEKEYEVTRGRVQMETVLGFRRLADDSWDYMIDPEKKIGYLRLTSFAPSTTLDLRQALATLKRQGMKSLVLDLRFNPGGTLTGAKDISDLFIDDQAIVSIKNRAGQEARYKGKSPDSLLGFPMVCMINGGSASASEIVSACLQDNERATIVGERSYGKGSVQNVIEFDGGDLKLTIAAFYRPSGKNLNKSSTDGKPEDEWGVKPDKGYEIVLTPGETEALEEALRQQEIIRKVKKPDPKEPFKDRQLEKALEYLKK